MRKYLFLAIVTAYFASVSLAQSGDLRIAYNVLKDEANDDYEVWVMNLDGTGKTNLTNNPDVAWTYHAYGDTIFFISDRGACKRCYFLYKMDSVGRNVTKVSDLQLEDSWMSTRDGGKEIAVSGRIGEDIRYQLFVIDVESGKYRQITDERESLFSDPLFTPDGKRIIFRYKTERKNRGEFEDLYIMDADGSGRTRLTTYPKDDKTSEWHSYHAGPPRWNTRGGFITYQSFQKGKSSLYAVSPDGKKQWKLIDRKMNERELNEGWHDWSPDGKWLAVEMYDKGQTEFGIHLMNLETGETKKLTDPEDFKYQQAPVFVEMPNPAEVVRRFVDAYNKKDIDAMIALVADDIKWYSINKADMSVETANAAALRKFLEDYFKKCPSCRSTVSGLRRNGNTVSFLETTSSGQSSLAVYDVVGGEIVRAYYFSAVSASAEKFDQGLAERLGADDYGMKTYVFAILKTGKTKLTDEGENQKVMAGHLENITRLANEGKLVLAGPFLEGDSTRGIFVFDVRTKEEAEELVKTDPAVAAGVFEVELRLWYGSAALLEIAGLHKLISAKSIVD